MIGAQCCHEATAADGWEEIDWAAVCEALARSPARSAAKAGGSSSKRMTFGSEPRTHTDAAETDGPPPRAQPHPSQPVAKNFVRDSRGREFQGEGAENDRCIVGEKRTREGRHRVDERRADPEPVFGREQAPATTPMPFGQSSAAQLVLQDVPTRCLTHRCGCCRDRQL